jgi:formate dehydrogenase iron-sulfur subunit
LPLLAEHPVRTEPKPASRKVAARADSFGAAETVDSSITLIEHFLATQSRLTAVETFSQRHDAHALPEQAKYYRDLIPAGKPGRGEQYAFVVDLDKCSGCKACVCACHSLNGLDEGETWRSVGLLISTPVDHSRAGRTQIAFPDPYQQHVTTACHHCVEPACADGCPVLAYEKDPETGIVRHLDDQCIGCQYCVLKCPYDVPKYSKSKGIVRKCDMCHSRLAVGEAPACVQACPHEAIRINVVDQATTRTAGAVPNAKLVPGAFPSHYTLPATQYVSSKPLPVNARPAGGSSLRVEPAHWPLVFMLILTQLAAGMHLVSYILAASNQCQPGATAQLAAAGALLLGLALSVTHLGRPLKAWRAFLGWRRSWMSREILAFSLYASLAGMLVFTGGTPWVSLATTVAGLLSVACSAMIYIDTRRPSWAAPIVLTKFFGTTLLLGATASATLAAWFTPALAPMLAIVATIVRTALFAWESRNLLAPDSPRHRGALIALKLLAPLVAARMALFIVSTVFSLMAIFNIGQAAVIWGSIAFATTLTAQLLERHMFFITCTAPRMP